MEEEAIELLRTNLTPPPTPKLDDNDDEGLELEGDASLRKGSFLRAEARESLSCRALSAGEGFGDDEIEAVFDLATRARLGRGAIVLLDVADVDEDVFPFELEAHPT